MNCPPAGEPNPCPYVCLLNGEFIPCGNPSARRDSLENHKGEFGACPPPKDISAMQVQQFITGLPQREQSMLQVGAGARKPLQFGADFGSSYTTDMAAYFSPFNTGFPVMYSSHTQTRFRDTGFSLPSLPGRLPTISSIYSRSEF